MPFVKRLALPTKRLTTWLIPLLKSHSGNVIAKICDAFEIQPNEILEWVKSDEAAA